MWCNSAFIINVQNNNDDFNLFRDYQKEGWESSGKKKSIGTFQCPPFIQSRNILSSQWSNSTFQCYLNKQHFSMLLRPVFIVRSYISGCLKFIFTYTIANEMIMSSYGIRIVHYIDNRFLWPHAISNCMDGKKEWSAR